MKRDYILKNFLIFLVLFAVFFAAIIPAVDYFNIQQAKEDALKLFSAYERQIEIAEYSDDETERKRIFSEIVGLDDETLRTTRITVLSANGEVLLAETTDSVASQATREEIVAAIGNKPRFVTRKSESFDNLTMLYYAELVGYGDTQVILRVAVNRVSVSKYMWYMLAVFGVLLVAAALLYFVIAKYSVRRYIKPLETVKKKLAHLADGHFDDAQEDCDFDELRAVMREIGKLSDKICTQIADTEREKNTFKFVLSNMGQGVVALNGNGDIVTVNKEAEKIFGKGDYIGKNHIFLCHDPEFCKGLDKILDSAGTGEFDMMYRGREYNVRICESDNLSENIRHILVITDVTSGRHTERVKREFFENASHELKTPLTAIKGFAELIVASGEDGKTVTYAEKIRSDADRMLALINDMLYLSSLEKSGTGTESYEYVDLREVAEECVERESGIARDKGVEISVEGSARVIGSRMQIERLVDNLLSNAVNYNKRGGKVIIAIEDGEKVRLTVSDNGIGIAEEHLPRLFERFYLVDKSRSKSVGGTGLGLSIVKHIVESMGGKVSVRSKLGEGTTFTVEF